MLTKRVLVVDDDEIVRNNFSRIFQEEKSDIQVYTVQSKDEALQKVQEATFDLVLVDLALPSRHGVLSFHTGLSLIEELRVEYPSLSIVVLSQISDRPLIIEALKLGATDYIGKGELSQKQLLARVHLYLGLPWPPQGRELSDWREMRAIGLLTRAQQRLEILDEKRDFLANSFTLASDASEKFKLQKEIDAIQAVIQRQEKEIEELEATLKK